MRYVLLALFALSLVGPFDKAYACDDDRTLSEMKRHNKVQEQHMRNEERARRDSR